MQSNDAYAELAELLTEAATVIDSVDELNMFCPFNSPTEFSSHVREIAGRVGRREHAVLRTLIPIFAPTGAWDDMGGGMELANRVMALLDLLQWNAELGAAPAPPRVS